MIRAEGIYKSFEEKRVLSDINVAFDSGKVNLIIGKSGSGKTVLLKSLIGLHTIDKGKIYYGDREITGMNIRQLKVIREEIGVVFQGGALWLVSVTCKDRLQYCRQKSCYSCKDSNLSIGKSTGKKKKTGKTHDCCKIHPVQSLDDCIGRGKIFGF